MSNDLITRLRSHVDPAWGSARDAMHEAADEIERLRAALVEAEHAMTKARVWGGMAWHYNPLHPMHYVPALEAIRAALQPETAP